MINSLFTAESPSCLSKQFIRINPDGSLEKKSGGQLAEGTVQRIELASMAEFADMLTKLKPCHALAYGLPAHDKARIVPQGRLAHAPKGDLPVIARVRDNFTFPAGPGILMLDYDPPKSGDAPLTPDQLLEVLTESCIPLASAPMVACHSASSHIWHGDKQLIDQRGLRVYVLVADARDIPRAGKVLFRRLWMAGHGRIELSTAGTMLVRGPVDDSVWQPERLDFAGGALCLAPLEQRRPAPRVLNNDAPPLDTRTALPDLDLSEEELFKKLVGDAKKAISGAAAEAQTKWVESRVETILAKEGRHEATDPDRAEKLRETLKQACTRHVLYGDFELLCQDGKTVTVGEVLDNPTKWHNKRFSDPLEPEYGGHDKRIAYMNLRAGGRPYLFSHAHGGQRFTLNRARKELKIVAGERVGIVNSVLELMRLDGGIFERGGELVRVGQDGEIVPLGLNGVHYVLDGLARWMKYYKTGETWVPADAPKNIAEGVIASRGSWGLPKLTAVVTAPIMELPSGRIIDMDGHDEKSGLLLMVPAEKRWPTIPEKPRRDLVSEALATLYKPFALFPFCTPVDKGVFLSALLTALVRPVFETAPGFAFTASTAGSGKTLLARCMSILAGQPTPSVMAGAGDDQEMRKRLLALGRSGVPVIVLDNLTGTVESDALCAWLTNETFSDRVLGVSEQVAVPTRVLTLLTGNNITLKGDLCRRVLNCRIDPGIEAPWRRGFDLDPAEHCRTHRMEMVMAGLTVLRAGMAHGKAPADRLASFETWSDTVRRAVLYVRDLKLMEGIEDPALAIDAAYDEDPETTKLRSLLTVWSGVFSDEPTTVAQAIASGNKRKSSHDDQTLWEALEEIAGTRGEINPRILGRWIERNKGRIVDGLRFDPAGSRKGLKYWKVREKSV